MWTFHLPACNLEPFKVEVNQEVKDGFDNNFIAEVIIEHLPDFNVDHTAEDDCVNRFVTAMVALYREEIAQLLRQRDTKHAELVAQFGEADAYEKASGIEVLSQIPIDLDEKLGSMDLG